MGGVPLETHLAHNVDPGFVSPLFINLGVVLAPPKVV